MRLRALTRFLVACVAVTVTGPIQIKDQSRVPQDEAVSVVGFIPAKRWLSQDDIVAAYLRRADRPRSVKTTTIKVPLGLIPYDEVVQGSKP